MGQALAQGANACCGECLLLVVSNALVDVHRAGYGAQGVEPWPLNTVETSLVWLESLTDDVWLQQAGVDAVYDVDARSFLDEQALSILEHLQAAGGVGAG